MSMARESVATQAFTSAAIWKMATSYTWVVHILACRIVRRRVDEVDIEYLQERCSRGAGEVVRLKAGCWMALDAATLKRQGARAGASGTPLPSFSLSFPSPPIAPSREPSPGYSPTHVTPRLAQHFTALTCSDLLLILPLRPTQKPAVEDRLFTRLGCRRSSLAVCSRPGRKAAGFHFTPVLHCQLRLPSSPSRASRRMTMLLLLQAWRSPRQRTTRGGAIS